VRQHKYSIFGYSNSETILSRGYQIYKIHHGKPVNYPKIFFFTNGSPKGKDEEKTCFEKDKFFKTSQLNSGGFGYI
jgi:hypothetical protein